MMKFSPKIILAVLLCMLLLTPGLKASGLTEFHTSAGLNSSASRDKSMSTLQYSGFGLSVSLALGHKSSKTYTFFRASYEYGALQNRYDKEVQRSSATIKNYIFYSGGKNRTEGFFAGWSNINSFVFNDYMDYSNFRGRVSY